MDAIPLEEISNIHAMQDFKSKEADNATGSVSRPRIHSLLDNASNRIRALRKPDREDRSADRPAAAQVVAPTHCIAITTEEGGYNSGRKYYLKASSEAERREIVQRLTRKYRAVRKSVEAKGRLRQIQDRALRLTSSRPFQYFFATLIITVGGASWPRRWTISEGADGGRDREREGEGWRDGASENDRVRVNECVCVKKSEMRLHVGVFIGICLHLYLSTCLSPTAFCAFSTDSCAFDQFVNALPIRVPLPSSCQTNPRVLCV